MPSVGWDFHCSGFSPCRQFDPLQYPAALINTSRHGAAQYQQDFPGFRLHVAVRPDISAGFMAITGAGRGRPAGRQVVGAPAGGAKRPPGWKGRRVGAGRCVSCALSGFVKRNQWNRAVFRCCRRSGRRSLAGARRAGSALAASPLPACRHRVWPRPGTGRHRRLPPASARSSSPLISISTAVRPASRKAWWRLIKN